ncbi:MAG: DUF2267 domain-containing protein [Bacteroidota bacterium]
MALNFNQYATEGNTFLKEYAKEIDLSENREKAGRILSAVLHGLRSMISYEESLQLLAQLPMFLKAVYVNGWSSKTPKNKARNMEEFIELIRTLAGHTGDFDFSSNERAEAYIHATFLMLRTYVSEGEMSDIRDELPKKLKGLIFERIFF